MMNIFKVFASRKKFPEEMMSVLAGYLIHPNMEHGLGRSFAERLLKEVVGENNTDIIHHFNATPDEKIRCSLEENVNTAFIDIVYFFGDYILAIENKIYDESVEEDQLEREYLGLIKKYPKYKIIMVYLVPYISPGAKYEYKALEQIVEFPNKSSIITWSQTITKIINEIITDIELSLNKVIPTKTHLILESLNAFIKDKYCGYNFVIRKGVNGTRSNFPRCTYSELKNKKHGFVGVALGTAGLLKMSKEEILSKGFQYDESTECDRQYWLHLNEFLNIANQKINGVTFPMRIINPIKTQKNSTRGSSSEGYMGKINSAHIYSLVCQNDCGRIFIGIKSGERGFIDTPLQKIDKTSWQVTSGKQPNSQWISGDRYKVLYEKKFSERKMQNKMT